jgi:tetratricopeptide (TPR) repeat protein
MAYQKSKNVEAAQKHLHQGKLAQAIAEYLVILKHEPKDQVTLMTVGDLFVRQGETFQALEYFERLAQIYLADGFLTKAIAIYKKITKLAPEEMRPVEKLADLYVQQGVMSEARPIYLQMAEMHQRANRPAQAVGLLRKLLDAEPDNPRVQSRLADLLVASSQPAEAVNVLRTAAQLLLRRGDHAEALQFADRALKIDPADAATLALRARALVGAGKHSDAVGMLESLPDVDAGGETSSLLVELYLDAGEIARASELAARIHARDAKRHAVVQHVAAALLDRSETDRALELLQRIHASVLEGGEHERFSELLGRVAEAMPGRIEPLEALVELYKHTSDSFRLPDALIHLAEAQEAAGNLQAAVAAYADFLEREPENETVRRKQESLQARLGLAGGAAAAQPPVAQPIEPPEPAETPAAPPAPEENLDQETQLFISQAITDVDLYSSYGLTQKALELLEMVLQRAPEHAPALERLLDLSLGLNDDARAVELATHLERIHTQCGNKAAAERFSDLRRRFERTAGASSRQQATGAAAASAQDESAAAEVPLDESAVPTVTAVPSTSAPVASPVPPEFQIPVVDAQLEIESAAGSDLAEGVLASDSIVHEVDLSEEWAALSSQPAEVAATAPLEAVEAYDRMLSGLDETAALAEPVAQTASQPSESAAESATEASADPLPAADFAPEPGPDVADAGADPLVRELLSEYEHAVESTIAAPPNGSSTGNIDSFMRSISAELEAMLPAPATIPPAAPPPAVEAPTISPAAWEAIAPESRGPLGDVFDEFRADIDESGEREDPETHYNLGIAYREMGLMEEAISEFQKVASAYQQGQPFRYALQCYTLLALAFAEKSQPSIAVSWFERALQVPGLDPETVLALRYDLGVSQEMAGDMEAARRSFSQVYGTNIDYRDVAERLAALGRSR